jgi:DNA-binding beta-propeller fold protein YncE
MTTDGDLDRQIQDYLQSGPAELSDRVLWAARAQLKTTRRRRARLAWLTPWRDHPMNQSTRLLLVAGGALALAVAIGAGVLSPFGKNGTGGGPSPAPSSPNPSAGVQPSAAATLGPQSSAAVIPVYPGQSASALSAAWETAGGSATKLGIPEMAADGRIWVASCLDNAFRILTPAGKLSESWGPPAGDPHRFNFTFPNGECNGAIAFAPDGGFWVLDFGNFRVVRFDKDRTYLGTWGRFGSGDGEFVHANDIAVDAVGSVFVADEGRHVIQVFTSDGAYVRSVAAGHGGSFISANAEGWVDTSLLPDGRPGLTEYKPDGSVQGGIDMPDLMPRPLGMTHDEMGSLYVVGLNLDDTPSTMVRFNPTGQGQDVWNAGGIAIAVSPAGDAAYVLSASTETIAKYVIPAP